MNSFRFVSMVCLLALSVHRAAAASPDLEKTQAARVRDIISHLRFQKGDVSIINGKVTLKLGDRYEYLDPADARKVLVDLAHNPPEAGSSDGIIVPAGWFRTKPASWFAVLEWANDGYIKDEEYDSLDFNKMLEQKKEEFRQQSEQRVATGYSKLLLLNWAQSPHYDKVAHKLYWAKEIDNGNPVHQLDYDIDVLGRAGVLKLNILADMPQLAEMQAEAPAILNAIEFTPTNRYTDYQKGDKVAEYTIGGLIGVGILAKAGFFKVLLLGLVKFWKLVAVGVAAIGSFFAKMFGRRKSA